MKKYILSENVRFKIFFTVALIILTPFYIGGGLFFILGRFISSFRYLFWLEPTKFVEEIKNIFTNIKEK